MANTISPDMGLVIPGVGTEISPTWATDLNSSLTIIDSHNHTPGSGVPIPPSGLNINSDLSFGGNNQISLRSSRYNPQTSPLSGSLDLGCVYVSGVDLYFNDENGNQIQITANGSIAGTSGSIANLTAPASASYVSGNKTFVWQSDANTAAAMDNGPVTIRKLTASSPGITLTAPSALTSNYTLTFPVSPPAQTSLLSMDNSGNIVSTSTAVDLTLTGDLDVTGDVTVGGTLNTDVINTSGLAITGGDVSVFGQISNTTAIISGTLLFAGTSVIATNSVSPTGASNANLVADNTTSIEIVNPGQRGSLIMTNDTFNAGAALMISGVVDGASGTPISNNGLWTSTKIGTGAYNITTAANVMDTSVFPVVTATIFGAASIPTARFAAISSSGGSYIITIQTLSAAPSGADASFSFIIIGQRNL